MERAIFKTFTGSLGVSRDVAMQASAALMDARAESVSKGVKLTALARVNAILGGNCVELDEGGRFWLTGEKPGKSHAKGESKAKGEKKPEGRAKDEGERAAAERGPKLTKRGKKEAAAIAHRYGWSEAETATVSADAAEKVHRDRARVSGGESYIEAGDVAGVIAMWVERGAAGKRASEQTKRLIRKASERAGVEA